MGSTGSAYSFHHRPRLLRLTDTCLLSLPTGFRCAFPLPSLPSQPEDPLWHWSSSMYPNMNVTVCSSLLSSTTTTSSPGLKEWTCRHFLLLFSGPLGHRLPSEIYRCQGLILNESIWCCDRHLRMTLNLSLFGWFRKHHFHSHFNFRRVTLQFTCGEIPPAEVAVWACVIPHGILQHLVLLGCNNVMRCEQRT